MRNKKINLQFIFTFLLDNTSIIGYTDIVFLVWSFLRGGLFYLSLIWNFYFPEESGQVYQNRQGGGFMDASVFPGEVSDIISGVVIYLCAFSLLFKSGILKFFTRKPKTVSPENGKEREA